MPVSEVRLVQSAGAERRNQVEIERLNMRWSFDAISRRAICGHVERLVGISRIVEVVGGEKLVLLIDGVIHAAEKCAVVNHVIHRLPLILR